MKDARRSLDLISDENAAERSWNGFAPTSHDLEDHAIPLTPQGAYREDPSEPYRLQRGGSKPLGNGDSEPRPSGSDHTHDLSVSLTDSRETARPVELLAPAGGPNAALAALHFGADAVYLGLKKFSARAEAENFTLEELDEITAYAHSLHPRRRVFVTVNTVIRQDELPELIEDLLALEEIGVDAIILQDLGVYRAIKQFFPSLELHGSTQMSVHNRAGAEALRQLGFARVVLARELTFEEVRDITAAAGIETEVFIHGALCYAYSGLCLFSAQTLGRSGNRGKCAYSCRDSFEVSGAPLTLRDQSPVKRDPSAGFPFSMKDLALPEYVPALRAAGVSCFKIEGRKKSPLYVATTTDYYRRLIDGTLDQAERSNIEADLQTVFSRPWTRLFLESAKDKEVADRDTVGHRGTPIGKVEAVLHAHTAKARVRFRTARRLERHDGLQVDLPSLGKPFGFAVDQLWHNSQNAISVPAGARVEVALPADHPAIPKGAAVYCSSSQEVKQRYRFARAKPGEHRTRRAIKVDLTLTRAALTASAEGVTAQIPGPFHSAKDAAAMAAAVRTAFERLGNSGFTLAELTWKNECNGFVPVSRLNQLRRDLIAKLQEHFANARAEKLARIQRQVCPGPKTSASERQEYASQKASGPRAGFGWSIKVDRAAFVDAFADADWRDVEEVVIDIARDHPAVLRERLAGLEAKIGHERIRLALPALTRAWEEKSILHKMETLRSAGWHKWEAANWSAWTYLDLFRHSFIDLSTDWSIYVLNRLAALQLLDMGVSRFTLSPEDGLENMRSLLSEFGDRAMVIVHQDTPLFIAESCAYANLIGGCPGKANCRFESMEMVSSHGEKVTALDDHCRTIVLNQGPYCLSTKLPQLAAAGSIHLRADFIYRKYEAEEVRRRWRLIRAGRPLPDCHAANFERGIL